MPNRMPMALRPMPRPVEKPPTPQPAKPFGGGFKTWSEMRTSARRFPWERSVLPGTGTKLGEKDRLGLVEKMRQLDPSRAGLTDESWRQLLKPRLEKEALRLKSAGEVNKGTKLQRDIKMFEEMMK